MSVCSALREAVKNLKAECDGLIERNSKKKVVDNVHNRLESGTIGETYIIEDVCLEKDEELIRTIEEVDDNYFVYGEYVQGLLESIQMTIEIEEDIQKIEKAIRSEQKKKRNMQSKKSYDLFVKLEEKLLKKAEEIFSDVKEEKSITL